ncbi:hypothetical protein B0T16DRAFT_214252 [Cercophora newfieldiana]|uniref:Uncharacterized protein n=1 Tax=Cercophora newfieldiana TaxID=92897 RepID=A0AA39XW71_9PEZI|nr:hypothetical protein B0T16DRAFT_214252 [Cercophora newfieldiana]
MVRTHKGLAVSQLELVTSAFCVCAVVTYAFLLAKPQGVEVAMRPQKLRRMTQEERQALHRDLMPLRGLLVPGLKPIRHFALGRIPNDFADDGEITGRVSRNSGTYAVGMAVGGVIFGAVHTAGWNLQFPSEAERTLWDISSILITLVLPFALCPVILHGWDLELPEWAPWTFGTPWFIFFSVLYVIARVFLLIETVRTLFYLPPSAFVDTWASSYVPHVS